MDWPLATVLSVGLICATASQILYWMGNQRLAASRMAHVARLTALNATKDDATPKLGDSGFSTCPPEARRTPLADKER